MFTVVPPQAAAASTGTSTSPWSYKPAVSSPLTKSSPPRPASPLSPLSASYGNRQPPTQSSPVCGPPKHSKFASRPVKPIPFARTRQEAQEGRRKQFFHGTRQRADERAWQRRDIEGFTLKQSMVDDNLRYRAAANDMAATDQDIEDAAMFASTGQSHFPARQPPLQNGTSWDEMMVEDVARYEQMGLDARLADMESTMSDYLMEDDDDFDQALLGLVDAPTAQPHQYGVSDGMDMS